MTKYQTPEEFAPFVIHFLGPLTVQTSKSLHVPGFCGSYGAELVVTPEMRAAGTDANGVCRWLDELLDDEPAQIRTWGQVMVRRGPWPKDKERIEPGSPQWDEERERARQAAWALPTEPEQQAAIAAVRAKYGMPSSAHSRTLREYPDS